MVIFNVLQEKFNRWFRRGHANSHNNTSDRVEEDNVISTVKRQNVDEITAVLTTINTDSSSMVCNSGLENTRWDPFAKKRKCNDVAWSKKLKSTFEETGNRNGSLNEERLGISRPYTMRNVNEMKNSLSVEEDASMFEMNDCENGERSKLQIMKDNREMKMYSSGAGTSNSLLTDDDASRKGLGINCNLTGLTMSKTHRLAEKSLFEKLIRARCSLGGQFSPLREDRNKKMEMDSTSIQQFDTINFLNINKKIVTPIQPEKSDSTASEEKINDVADTWYKWKVQESTMNAEINIVEDIKESYSKRLEARKLQMEEMKKQMLKAQSERNRDYLVERIKAHLKIKEEDVKKEEEKVKESVKEITNEMKKEMREIMRSVPKSGLIRESRNASLRLLDVKTLLGYTWLNDEVINQYMGMITNRSAGENNKSYPKAYCCTTFFYERLITSGYSGVRRWTKKVDIFENDIILVPIHLSVHWCMAAIDFRKKEIKYYDSMGSSNSSCLQNLSIYLQKEHQDKKGNTFSLEGWKKINTKKEVPQQENGSDCGVFACTFAEYISRDAEFDFGQKNMQQLREKMMYEILVNRLLN